MRPPRELELHYSLTAYVEALEPVRLPEYRWSLQISTSGASWPISVGNITGPQTYGGTSMGGIPHYDPAGSIVYCPQLRTTTSTARTASRCRVKALIPDPSGELEKLFGSRPASRTCRSLPDCSFLRGRRLSTPRFVGSGASRWRSTGAIRSATSTCASASSPTAVAGQITTRGRWSAWNRELRLWITPTDGPFLWMCGVRKASAGRVDNPQRLPMAPNRVSAGQQQPSAISDNCRSGRASSSCTSTSSQRLFKNPSLHLRLSTPTQHCCALLLTDLLTRCPGR